MIKVELKNPNKCVVEIKRIQAQSEQAVSRTISDMKARAPGAISSCVTELYNIKKSEVNPNSTKQGRKAVKMHIEGETVDALSFVYTGRRLTPTHFGMTPKAPPHGKSYTLTATIRKDNGKQVIGRYKNKKVKNGPYSQQSHNILMGTGNTKEGGTNYIPFQRMSTNRTDLKKFLTVSVPQMIGEETTVAPAIQAKINELLGTRLDYHMSKIK